MKKLWIVFCLLCSFPLIGQDTFSIVAVDEETGEIGSAGASCVVGAADLGGVILISEIIPGRGAVNGQATVCIPHVNLNNAIDRMELGDSPQEILDWLYDNDACVFGTNEDRQYGIVDLDENGTARSAAFTGNTTLSHAGHRVGPNYAIQGNILLGPQVLDSMEVRFLNATGTLAEKLMAALQGANIPGADSRCLDDGTSSTSAFLQVYRPDDAPDAPYLRINVEETATGVEPIDSVQVLFDEWLLTGTANVQPSSIRVFPNPAEDYLQIAHEESDVLHLVLYDLNGRELLRTPLPQQFNRIALNGIGRTSVCLYQISDSSGLIRKAGKLLIK